MEKNGDWSVGVRLRQCSQVNAAAELCRQALVAWEHRTRTEIPTPESLRGMLDGPLEKLRDVSAAHVGETETLWLASLHLDLLRSLGSREPVPRGSVPWGDDREGGCDRALRLLDQMFAELAGEPGDTLSEKLMLLTAMTTSPQASRKVPNRGFFAWHEADSKLILGPLTSTPFPQKLATARRILQLLATLPSHRAKTWELNAAFEDQNVHRTNANIDRHISDIRRWLESQPGPVWRAVSIVRDRDSVQLRLDRGAITDR